MTIGGIQVTIGTNVRAYVYIRISEIVFLSE